MLSGEMGALGLAPIKPNEFDRLDNSTRYRSTGHVIYRKLLENILELK